jgi:hypothetical protein
MNFTRLSLGSDKRAVSPAISTVILTGAGIVLILVAMTYAGNIMNQKLAENEFSSSKSFMQTTGKQMDDIAWTIGRTQTVTFANHFGNVKFQDLTLTYTFSVHTSSGWETLPLDGSTGVILYNMPIDIYQMGNGHFERFPLYANNSFLLSDASAPVGQVFCTQKLPMADGGYLRSVLAPTMRVLTSTIVGAQNSSYFKFYLPCLQNGTSPYLSQSLTLTGEGISKFSRSGVDQVAITVSFPRAASGFDGSFFNFKSTTITLNSTSTPKLSPNSIVEFYVGKVQVSIGAT